MPVGQGMALTACVGSIDDNGNDWVDFAPGDDLNELSFTMAVGDRVAVDPGFNHGEDEFTRRGQNNLSPTTSRRCRPRST